MNESISKSYQVGLLSQVGNMEVPAGERLCRIIFKGGKDAAGNKVAAKEESKGCFVPMVGSSFVSAFAAKYPEAVAEFIETLQDKKIRQVWESSRRSPCESDLGMDSLYEVWKAQERVSRLTAESIKEALKGELGNKFVSFLAKTRGISLEVAENVEMLHEVKNNYLPFFAFATARKPAFDTQIVKDKVVQVLVAFGEYLVESDFQSEILERALEKMIDAPLKTADVARL